jgi:nucleoside-diphosphate-sugar epimerase
MSVLVTGSNGFLGVSVVERLLARGERDLVLLLRSGSKRTRLDAVLRSAEAKQAKIELRQGSLATKEDAARLLEGCDTVYHLAAAMSGAAADMFLGTVVSTRNLLEAAASRPKPPKIVLCSSFAVYGVADLPRGTVVDERTPLENHPELRDPYSQSKLKQEQLVWEYGEKRNVPVTVVRPGVIFGPNGPAMSSRVGLNLFGVFLHLGGDNALPLTFVDNCADAIVVAGQSSRAVGEAYNVVDDDLLSAAAYLSRYKRDVKPLKSVRVPYTALTVLSHAVAKYHQFSKGQLPAVFTPYKTRATWKGNRFDNAKMKALGWSPRVTIEEGLRRTFESLRPSAA